MASSPSDKTDLPTTVRFGFWLGLIGGLLIVGLAGIVPRPEGLSIPAVRLVGVTFVVGVWWVTEALPLGATALLPAALFPLLDIATAESVSQAYMSPFIMVLLGGFLLALAVERSAVHRRLALHVLLGVGTSPRRLVLGFGVAAALLSMWISNTATTLIMMPIALAIADRARLTAPEHAAAFASAVLLGTAYCASVGGMGTPVGTPPNLMALGAMATAFPDRPTPTFITWVAWALPVVIVLVPVIWLILTRVYPKVPRDLHLGAGEVLRRDLKALGAWSRPEQLSIAVFGLAAVLWVTRPDLDLGVDCWIRDLGAWLGIEGLSGADACMIRGWASHLELKGVHDGTIAILMACVAFILPSGLGDGTRLLPWETALRVPWGLVLLFGGGVSLSKGFDATGLSAFLGQELARIAGDSPLLFAGISTLAAILGTEIISNTALANIAMPILAATAQAVGQNPELLMIPVALACSCAFMLPAATGPNAIVFGTDRIRIGQMARVGLLVNVAAWVVLFGYILLRQ